MVGTQGPRGTDSSDPSTSPTRPHLMTVSMDPLDSLHPADESADVRQLQAVQSARAVLERGLFLWPSPRVPASHRESRNGLRLEADRGPGCDGGGGVHGCCRVGAALLVAFGLSPLTCVALWPGFPSSSGAAWTGACLRRRRARRVQPSVWSSSVIFPARYPRLCPELHSPGGPPAGPSAPSRVQDDSP